MSGVGIPGFAFTAARLFALQSAFSYERMVGIGFAHALEPLLRPLRAPGDDARYRAALARNARFFNAHPYVAGLAVGATARAELDGEPPERIERMRTALCGPLGAFGDRLVWAGWLPASAAVGLALVAVGARGWGVAAFLILYNVVHVALRLWGLRAGWVTGTRVAVALSHPVMRRGLAVSGPVAALALGVALPLVVSWVARRGMPWAVTWDHAAAGAVGAVVFVAVLERLRSRLSGVVLAMVVLAGVVVAGVAWP